MNPMGYLKRIGKGVKALGGDGGSDGKSGDAVANVAGGLTKTIGGLFKKKSKAGASKPYNSSKADEIG